MILQSIAFIALSLVAPAHARLVSYDWEVSWVHAAPDGFSRPVVGINGAWPCPTIEASVGDTVRVRLTNHLGNQTSGLHFHGINQVSTNFMDGGSMVTQCPLPPNMTMTYEFTADAPGTYWYHSHNMGQYPDGLRGPMIVHDPKDPYRRHYDQEYTMTLSDWYHEQTIPLTKIMLSPNNTRHFPPLPQAMLVNDGQESNYDFAKGSTYRLRIVNFAALGAFMIQFGSHDMQVIAIDGRYVKRTKVSTLRISAAQRYDILISAKKRYRGNIPYLVSLDQNPDWTNPILGWPLNHTGYLVTGASNGTTPTYEVDVWRPYDDSKFKPLRGRRLPSPDKTIELDFTNCFDKNGIPRACFNGSPYVDQKVPTLYSAASLGEDNADPSVYGAVHPYIVNEGDVVDIIVNNHDIAVHPFHLHGHHFQVLARAEGGAGSWRGSDSIRLKHNPPLRDTIDVKANSYAVLRFEANNPGVYLFHCHIEWHVEMGLSATIIEAPDRLRGLKIPEDHLKTCRHLKIPTEGNAGGNLDDPFDDSNFNTEPPLEYIGATYVPPRSGPQSRLRPRSVRVV